MISWLNEYQGYIVYPSLILGMLWCWVPIRKQPILSAAALLGDSVDSMQGLRSREEFK